MPKRLFAVTRTRGPSWNLVRALEEQQDWAGHAKFMNALQAEGFVVLGGPLEGTPDVLLIVRAESEEEIRSRLAVDSWSNNELLTIKQIAPWVIRLGKIE
jgi:uncharacterized protein YciI